MRGLLVAGNPGPGEQRGRGLQECPCDRTSSHIHYFVCMLLTIILCIDYQCSYFKDKENEVLRLVIYSKGNTNKTQNWGLAPKPSQPPVLCRYASFSGLACVTAQEMLPNYEP